MCVANRLSVRRRSAPIHLHPPRSEAAMNSFEMNKILGAILATCLGVVALNIASGAIFSPPKLAKPGYEIAVPDHPKTDPHPAGGGAGSGTDTRRTAGEGGFGARPGFRPEMRCLPYLR